MRKFSDKFVEEIKKHVLFSRIFFSENRAVYEKKWKNFVERGWTQMTMWRMRIVRWIPKATNTHSDRVILNALPRQQWLN
jgi:hypothetical protein